MTAAKPETPASLVQDGAVELREALLKLQAARALLQAEKDEAAKAKKDKRPLRAAVDFTAGAGAPPDPPSEKPPDEDKAFDDLDRGWEAVVLLVEGVRDLYLQATTAAADLGFLSSKPAGGSSE
jgi:hypothetical protein